MNFPKYIEKKNNNKISSTNAMVLIWSNENKARYWRHGGCYTAKAEYIDGRLMVYILANEPVEYVACTEEQWKESNGEYATEEYSYKGFFSPLA